MESRKVFEAIIFIATDARTALPKKEFALRSIHHYFEERKGVFSRVFGVRDWRNTHEMKDHLAAKHDRMRRLKASFALEAVGANPTDRGKKWDQESLLVDGNGIPLSLS